MKKTILGLLVLWATTLWAGAQQVSYLNYRAAAAPQTSCFASKGELRLSLLRQTYVPDIGWTSGEDFGYRAKVALTSQLENYLLVSDNQLNISYSLTNNISLSGSYLHSTRSELFVVEGGGSNIPYRGKTNAIHLGGAYRGRITPNLQWELGTSVTMGGGKFNFEEQISFELQHEKSYLSYNTFTHNLLGSISFSYHKLQLTTQLNAGYLRHFKLRYTPVLPYAYENIVQQFYAHQTDFYVEPALIVSINFQRLGLHYHFAYPYVRGESRVSKPTPTLGLGLSYRIFKGHNGEEQ